jgi:hypothetical protein
MCTNIVGRAILALRVPETKIVFGRGVCIWLSFVISSLFASLAGSLYGLLYNFAIHIICDGINQAILPSWQSWAACDRFGARSSAPRFS